MLCDGVVTGFRHGSMFCDRKLKVLVFPKKQNHPAWKFVISFEISGLVTINLNYRKFSKIPLGIALLQTNNFIFFLKKRMEFYVPRNKISNFPRKISFC